MITWSVNLNPNRLDPELRPDALEAATPQALEHLETLGARGVRVDLFWHWLMPTPWGVNEAALAWYRDFFAQLKARGLTPFVLLYHPPEWAMALLDTDEALFLEAWARFCRLVRALELPLVQIWNEPNNFLAGLKGDAALFDVRRVGKLALPTGVRWHTLAAMFAIARAELPESRLVYNVLANLSPFLPAKRTWLDWEHFTQLLLERAGEAVDVIALDHYPDTWAPGAGPLEWECLDIARRHVNTPGSVWHGKAIMIGEVGYSSAPNFHLVEWPLKWGRFFPGERDEVSMADWYGAALCHLQTALTRARFPHNTAHWINLYELFDAPHPVGAHAALRVEEHFGLVRRDGTPKLAYHVVREAMHGTLAYDLATVGAPRVPLPWRLARWAEQWRERGQKPAVQVLERTVPAALAPLEAER
ncbi:MAG TPA: family 1 glycosylhydrolase [Oscillatoriaceae cyanobacterium]